jgi:uncharacterized protein (TIGR03437 family)
MFLGESRMARAVQGNGCIEAFPPSGLPDRWRCALKKLYSILSLNVFLLATGALHAQTLNISPNPLNITTQANTSATAQLTLTSSTSAAITLYSITPTVSWLHASLPTSPATTPQTITVTVDPLAASATAYTGYLTILSSDSTTAHSVPVSVSVSSIGVSPSTLTFAYTAGSGDFPAPLPSTLTVPSGTTVGGLSANTTSGGSWLQAELNGTPPDAVTALINTSVVQSLAPGTYTGAITITPTAGFPATIQVTLVVSAAPTLTPAPTSLSFYYQVNGTNNVTTQPITLTAGSQSVSFAFTGGSSWITPNPPSGTVQAGQSLTVNVTVTPPSSCTPSTSPCSGTLTFSTSGPAQNIPVTLTVSNNPLLNLNATSIPTFAYQIGTTPPAAVSVTPGSTGAALSYTVTAATNSGGSWLTVTPTSGTTPTPVSIGLNPITLDTLGPGTYNGTVSFTASGVTQSIAVTLTVTNNPMLVVSASPLWFAYQIGQASPASQTVTLTSSNGAPLSYSATTTTSWLILTGQTSGTTNNLFTVSASTSGLTAGTYSGQITIAATNQQTGTALAPVNIPVTLYVSSNALLLVNPPQPVVFTAQANSGQSAPLQNVTLASTSTDVLALVWGQPTVPWLGVFGAPAATPGTVGLQATPPANLAPGTYTGSVTVTATGPAGAVLDSPAATGTVIPVVLNLTSGTISVAPAAGLSFTQSIGASAPLAQSVAVTSTVPGLTFIPSAYDGGLDWLSVSSPTGTTNGSFNVSVNGSKLTTGKYQGEVVVLSPFAAGSPAVIPVTFTVIPGTISAPTTTLSFTQVQNGVAPATQNVTVSGSPGPLNFTVTTSTTDGNAWLAVTPQTGTTPATLQIGLSAVAGTLQPGPYTGTVTITSPGASGSPVSIPVTLTVVAPQTFTVSPMTLAFNFTIGLTAPPAQSFQVTSGGSAPFTVTTPSSATWLQVSPTSGSTPATLSVAVNTQGLAAGNYNAMITINSPYATTAAAASVTVNLTVLQITVKPTAITNAASYAAGAVSPGENIVLFGTSIGPPTLTYGTLTAGGASLSTSAGNTQVLFDGIAAPVVYASAMQTSVMVPYEVAGRTATSVVVMYQGVPSAALPYNVVPSVPGIYTQNFQGTGPGAILNQDGVTVNGPGTLAAKGSVVSVYMTGEGQTSPAGVTGAIAPVNVPAPWKQPLLKATATIGGLPAPVQYYGSAPGEISGVMQVNVQIPANAPSGALPIVITLTNPSTGLTYSTQAQVTVSVQ